MSEAAEELDFQEGEEINLKAEPVEQPEPEKAEEKTEEVKEEPKAEEEKPKVEFTPEQQEVFNEAIARKVAAQREAERKAEEVERKAREYEEKLAKYETPERPEVPPLPDPYDDDYDAKIRERDEAIAARVKYDNEAAFREQQRQQAEWQQQQEENQKREEIVKGFYGRGEKLGKDQAELDTAIMTLVNQGLAGAKGKYIMEHSVGPDLATYLAKNALEGDKIAQMSDMQAAEYIAAEIIPKVKAARDSKVIEKSPPELDTPGAGVGIPDENYGAEGWTIT